jgi:hypothetical protein
MCNLKECPLKECFECRDCSNFEKISDLCWYNCDNPPKVNPHQPVCDQFIAGIASFPLFGVSETAKFLNWHHSKVSTYFNRHVLPEPIAILASGPIWTRRQIEQYRDELQAKKQHSK